MVHYLLHEFGAIRKGYMAKDRFLIYCLRALENPIGIETLILLLLRMLLQQLSLRALENPIGIET